MEVAERKKWRERASDGETRGAGYRVTEEERKGDKIGMTWREKRGLEGFGGKNWREGGKEGRKDIGRRIMRGRGPERVNKIMRCTRGRQGKKDIGRRVLRGRGPEREKKRCTRGRRGRKVLDGE